MRRFFFNPHLCLLAALLALLVGGVAFAEEHALIKASQNPEYVRYLERAEGEGLQRNLAGGVTRRGGVIPSPVDFSHLRSADYSSFLTKEGALQRSSAPARYDMRALGYLTPVRNQGEFGVCWAFGALASVESYLKKNQGKETDLSELHLAWYAFKDKPGFSFTNANPLDDGGHNLMSAAMLSRWAGAVLEKDLPYPANHASPMPSQPASAFNSAFHIQQVYVLDIFQSRVEESVLKKLIMELGAVSVAYDEGTYYHNETYNSYYNDGSLKNAGHQITFVGWDDSFPKEHFGNGATPLRPARNGAWLARNSWGTDFGDQGYFWISYEDASLREGGVFVPEAADNYDRVYYHDPLGFTSAMGFSNFTAWGANRFTAKEQSTLEAVSFYTTDANVRYEIAIYKGGDASSPISGTRVLSGQQGTETFAGYHTVELNTPVALKAGESFTVVIQFSNSGYNYPLAVEGVEAGYSDQATAAAGQSYVSSNGQKWSDITSQAALKNTNLCIKAFTNKDTSGGGSGGGESEGESGVGSGSSGGCNAISLSGWALFAVIGIALKRKKHTH